jgi:DNA-binding NarL/FixJ family response regulator
MNQIAYIVRDLEARGVRLPKLRRSELPGAVPATPVCRTPPVAPKSALSLRVAVAKRRARIAQLWRSGQSSRDISLALNMPVKAVKTDIYQLQCLGELPLRRLDMASVKLRRKRVVELYGQGLSSAEISAQLNMSVQMVYRDTSVLRKRGDLAPVTIRAAEEISHGGGAPHAAILVIIAVVAAEFKISSKDILGKSRVQEIAFARHEVCLRALDAGLRVSQIARALGRDRSSVMSGVNAAALRRSRKVKQ